MTFLYRLPVEEKSLKKCLLWNSFCMTCHFLITSWLFGAIKRVFSMMELSVSWFGILTLHLSRCSFILVIFFVFFHCLYDTGFLRIKINSALIGAPLFLGYHFVFFILLTHYCLLYFMLAIHTKQTPLRQCLLQFWFAWQCIHWASIVRWFYFKLDLKKLCHPSTNA